MAASAAPAVGLDQAPVRAVRLGQARHSFEHHEDGTVVIRAEEELPPYPDRLSDHLVRWAAEAPDRTFLAKRGASGAWVRLTYAEALERARRVGAALLKRGLSAERPLVILSGNDLDHAVLGLAALHVGIPYAPISPAYSRTAPDFLRLRDIVGLLTPGLVYAADWARFTDAIAAAVPAGTEVVTRDGVLPGRDATTLDALDADADAADRAHAAVTPDTIAKYLFTSGSTGLPKAVVNTHRMLCANQAQIAAGFPFLANAPPVLVDWLPWHHTFGGNHNFNIVLANGGSLYVDEGQPTPEGIGETVRNLSEIAPTAYLTVPRGYEALIPHLERNGALRETFFARLQMAFYAAAGLPQPVWNAFDAVAVRHCGERIAMLTGLGSTETAPGAVVSRPDHRRAGQVGLPLPGITLKLTPVGEKREARLKGPNITPGYWRNPAASAAAFDEEGFYRLGDAFGFVDPADESRGLTFDGRLNEDFKLTSGVWVSVGAVRAAFLDRCAPLARDVALAGENRADIAGLAIPNLDACRALCPDLAADAPAAAILSHPRVRDAFAKALSALAQEATGSSTLVARVVLVAEPPSIDRNEMTDKGSINQRTLLRNRADLVEALYGAPLPPHVIVA